MNKIKKNTDQEILQIKAYMAKPESDIFLNRTTELCVDVKTFLRTDKRAILNKDYTGVLTRDGEDHFKFVETDTASTKQKRHPHSYKGELITATIQSNGKIRLNFRLKRNGEQLTIEAYALNVANEIVKALTNLI